ncbi:unnamed protein product [Clonostachys rhizophaga]|uniref:Uncharacterized protein n=1 Tax=Clonostachys rhizophaga TaxID=160324 RepID=A0A9N9VIG4_9HYPO|nr:unnamed protein product [Clonostachys rhizophaga]
MSAIPATQINYLEISQDVKIEDQNTDPGRLWKKALDLLEAYDGFRRLYWGRSPEDWSKVQLHVVRDHLSQHQGFQKTSQYEQFQSILRKLIVPSSVPFTRHAFIEEFTPNNQALGRGAPFSGTAIYIDTDESWHVGAWPLWTHIVRHVDGCLGVTGGRVVESVDGHHNCYVVYVGWESIEKHDAYHHTRHFANRRVVLALGNKGWKEYGHVKLQGAREAKEKFEEQTGWVSKDSKL